VASADWIPLDEKPALWKRRSRWVGADPAERENDDAPRFPREIKDEVERVISRWVGSRLEQIGLSPTQLEVLDVLRQQERVPLRQLWDAQCCVDSDITALVDRMERDGLVRRSRDPDDRRIIRLFLGAAGRERLALDNSARRCPETLNALNAQERRQLVLLLRKLVDGLGCSPGRDCSLSEGEQR
jgi:DNA-binding MarR family transcriptional regulator